MSNDNSAPSEGGINVGVAIVGFILCFFAGAGIMWIKDSRHPNATAVAEESSGAATGIWSDEESPVPISSKDPVWGHRDAPVTIVQFSDFQCPYCSKVELSIDQLKKDYGPEKLRVVWKNKPLPFHPDAKPAAEAAMGVFALKGSVAFWKFHDLAFRNQSALSATAYETWAQEAGVDLAKWKAGIAAHTWAEKVDGDDLVASSVKVKYTPSAFVNGVLVSGAQPYEKWKAVVDEELGKALAKIRSGTPKDHLYVTMSRENQANAPSAASDAGEEKDDTTTVWSVPVEKSPVRGNPDAQVTIIEFSDFQCPYCGRVEPTLKAIMDKYGDKVRLVWKHEPLPFHPRAEPAAELAMEAREEKGDKGFWEVHDKLFASQPRLEEADLEKVAKEAGLSLEKVREAMKTHKYRSFIDHDEDLADDMQAASTPCFFVNGRRLVGAQPPEKFGEIIDDEIKKTNALLGAGASPATLYETIIKDGKGPPPLEKKDMVVPSNAPSRGNAKAKVTIVEYSDFQCPFCKRSEEAVTEVMKNYGDKIKLVWRNMPLPMHPDAPLAAQASMEAWKQKGAAGFWKMHDLLYANQPDQKRSDGLKREALDGYARELGLDMNKWKTALDTQSHKAEVDADVKAGSELGLEGTPAFLINGYFIDGDMPYPKFRKAIERALAEAR
jgi:protein-disulfide isomerase